MATQGDLRASAEEKLKAAEAALLVFVESKKNNPAVRQRLIDELNRAIADYEKFVDNQ